MKTLLLRLCGPAALTLSLLLGAFTAEAHASEYFGQRGQFFLGGGSTLNAMTWTHQKYKDINATSNNVTFGLSPQVGVFVTRNLYLALDLGFSAVLPGKTPADLSDAAKEIYHNGTAGKALGLSVGPRIGFNIDFGRGVSLLPNLGLGYAMQRRSERTRQQIYANLAVPFVFQIAQHGALLVGPTATYRTNADKPADPLPATFDVGLTGGLLIWI